MTQKIYCLHHERCWYDYVSDFTDEAIGLFSTYDKACSRMKKEAEKIRSDTIEQLEEVYKCAIFAEDRLKLLRVINLVKRDPLEVYYDPDKNVLAIDTTDVAYSFVWLDYEGRDRLFVKVMTLDED